MKRRMRGGEKKVIEFARMVGDALLRRSLSGWRPCEVR
jgi:hypothetical protein